MPASGHQDHTTSPSASVPFVKSTNRVHRIPRSTSVTIAIRPSDEAGWNRDIPASTQRSSVISEIQKLVGADVPQSDASRSVFLRARPSMIAGNLQSSLRFRPHQSASMPRFYINFRNADEIAKDDIGVELPSLEDARAVALISAREIVADNIKGNAKIRWRPSSSRGKAVRTS